MGVFNVSLPTMGGREAEAALLVAETTPTAVSRIACLR